MSRESLNVSTTDVTPRADTDAIPFAEFSTRLLCVVGDSIVFLLLVTHLPAGDVIGRWLSPLPDWLCVALGLVVYFAVFPASPLRATPLQFITGIRVVDYTFIGLGTERALLRATVKTTVLAAAASLVGFAEHAWLLFIAVPGLIMAFLAAVTPYHQALHDVVARTVTVKRSFLAKTEGCEQLASIRIGTDTDRWRRFRGRRILGVLNDAAIVAIPIVLIVMAMPVVVDRDLHYRTNYAFNETSGLRTGLEFFHIERGRWPRDAEEFGEVARTHYPDGGYYELEQDGRIRIRFEHKKLLKEGSIVLIPVVATDGYTWTCAGADGFDNRRLPYACRTR